MIPGLLRDREFRAFLAANALERFAAAAMTVLLGFQVYELTHNPLDLGWLGLAEAIPGVTLVLYGGHVADRRSRRRIVLATSALLAVLAGGVAVLSGTATQGLLYLLFLVAFLSGAVRAFEGPAASGLEAQVVPLAQVMRGVSLLATTGRLADVLGPVAGGFAWAALGPVGTYAAIAALFALACLALLTGVGEKPPLHVAHDGLGVRRRIADGVRPGRC
jgi:MFS family permease